MSRLIETLTSDERTQFPAQACAERLTSGAELPPPSRLAAILAWIALGDDPEPGPPLVHQRASQPALKHLCRADDWAKRLPRGGNPIALCLSAGLLQMHDFWDESHAAAQEADDLGERDLSIHWHAIAHRREPDPGNAAYWYRRVGRSPIFPKLSETADQWVERDPAATQTIWQRLLGSSGWDPLAFIDVCGRVQAGSADEIFARRLQRLEMALLMDRTAQACGLL